VWLRIWRIKSLISFEYKYCGKIKVRGLSKLIEFMK
jgi:hypothetical protein